AATRAPNTSRAFATLAPKMSPNLSQPTSTIALDAFLRREGIALKRGSYADRNSEFRITNSDPRAIAAVVRPGATSAPAPVSTTPAGRAAAVGTSPMRRNAHREMTNWTRRDASAVEV